MLYHVIRIQFPKPQKEEISFRQNRMDPLSDSPANTLPAGGDAGGEREASQAMAAGEAPKSVRKCKWGATKQMASLAKRVSLTRNAKILKESDGV